jgi:hypothetical protein
MTQIINFLHTNIIHLTSYIFAEHSLENIEENPPFGAKQWGDYGLTVKEPAIPERFKSTLEAHCPFWPPQQVKQTHFLCLVPKGLTYDQLLQLASSKKTGSIDFEEADWILITKRTVPKTSALPFQAQDEYLAKNGYDTPHSIEAAIAVLCAKHCNTAVFARREESTRCQEQENSSYLVIGMDSKKDICSYRNNWDIRNGVAAVMR